MNNEEQPWFEDGGAVVMCPKCERWHFKDLKDHKCKDGPTPRFGGHWEHHILIDGEVRVIK